MKMLFFVFLRHLRMGFLLDKQPRRKAVFEVAFVFLTLGDCHLLPQFFNQCIVLFAQTLTPKDILIVLSASGQSARLEEVSAAAKGRDVPVLLITCDSHGPLAQLADYVMTASNREQRLIEGSHAASLLSPNVLIEVLYYLLRMENL